MRLLHPPERLGECVGSFLFTHPADISDHQVSIQTVPLPSSHASRVVGAELFDIDAVGKHAVVGERQGPVLGGFAGAEIRDRHKQVERLQHSPVRRLHDRAFGASVTEEVECEDLRGWEPGEAYRRRGAVVDVDNVWGEIPDRGTGP